MHARLRGVIQPCVHVGFHLDALQAIERCRIEAPGCAVELGGIACRHHDPALRQGMLPECFELQELQHGRGKRLGHAVHLVKQQNALRDTRALDVIVHRRDDLAHGVFGNRVRFALVFALNQTGESQRALAGVVRYGIRQEIDAAFLCRLLHNGGFAHARRALKEYRALHLERDAVRAVVVARKICRDGIFDLLFR